MAGIERVEVLIMKRRLRWLGHLEWLDDNHLPKCLLVYYPQAGKCSIEGQKKRWCDVVMHDLKICDLLLDWCDVEQVRAVWRAYVNYAAQELNHSLEEEEARKKDMWTERREGCNPPAQLSTSETVLRCDEPGCEFTSCCKAGLVNHTRQKHGTNTPIQQCCT